MKEWSAEHPKAKLMARKRAGILASAKAAFLESGYGGTSMEGIAKAADVSIMTLYRHAQSKDDLFSAVIANACDPNDPREQAEFARMAELSFPDLLTESALYMQKILTRPDTVALMRVVMAEASRFPHLAELAYQGFIVRLEAIVAQILAHTREAGRLAPTERESLGRLFVDRIVGSDMLRVLLGMAAPSSSEQRARAERARDDILRELEALKR